MVTLLAGTNVQGQTVDEIVKKHEDAIGGVAAWKKVNSIKDSGDISTNGTDFPITYNRIAGKGLRIDMEVMGMHGYQILTRSAGWSFYPWGGQTKPEPITPDAVRQGASQLELTDHLFDYAAKGYKVEFIGKDDVDGTECLKLKVTTIEGTILTDYIDPTTYFLIREVQKVTSNGRGQDFTSNFSNFQKLPEGIIVPMTIGTLRGEYKITRVEINTITDESIFKPEESKKG